ncbi:unnamed protein product [Lampetra fluviatilis]
MSAQFIASPRGLPEVGRAGGGTRRQDERRRGGRSSATVAPDSRPENGDTERVQQTRISCWGDVFTTPDQGTHSRLSQPRTASMFATVKRARGDILRNAFMFHANGEFDWHMLHTTSCMLRPVGSGAPSERRHGGWQVAAAPCPPAPTQPHGALPRRVRRVRGEEGLGYAAANAASDGGHADTAAARNEPGGGATAGDGQRRPRPLPRGARVSGQDSGAADPEDGGGGGHRTPRTPRGRNAETRGASSKTTTTSGSGGGTIAVYC